MEGGGLLSESTERLEVLRPLSLPPDGKAKPADRRREGKSRGEHFKHESEPLSAAQGEGPSPKPPGGPHGLLIQPRGTPFAGPVVREQVRPGQSPYWFPVPAKSGLAVGRAPSPWDGHSPLLLCRGCHWNPESHKFTRSKHPPHTHVLSILA